MKYGIYTLLLALTMQSCSHIAVYKETHYSCTDSPYPCSDMQFAYYANHKSLLPTLKQMGDRICTKAQADSVYNSFFPSTDEFEMQNDTFMVERKKYYKTLDDSRNLLSSIKISNNHSEAAFNGHQQIAALSACKTSYFTEYWKRVYQLSHRSILQHYMTTDSRYRGLSSTNKALLYGYILKKDIDNCEALAKEAAEHDKATIAGLQAKINKEVSRHEEIQAEIKRREAAEREKERQRKEAERQEQLRREEQEAARQRWNDDSWMNGHWLLRTQFGTINLYIDTKNQKIKVYGTLFSSSRPELMYSGSYRLYNDAGAVYGSKWNGYKALHFKDTTIFADPDAGTLYDPEVGYYESRMEKVRWYQ